MKRINLLVLSLLGALTLSAQSYEDALRYSESFAEGDARSMAMGGAVSSLGGNIAALSANPAGSAVFKKNVVEFTPCYIYTKSENYYLGYDNAFTSKMKIPSFGIVGYKPIKQSDVFISGLSYGFAMNAQNRYNSTINFSGINNSSSLTDDFLRLANDDNWQDSYSQLAWDTYLVDTLTGIDQYYTPFVNNLGSNYGEYQDIEYDRDGVKREFLFNFGIDFSEYVFFGADLSFTNIYYNEKLRFSEIDDNDVSDVLQDFTYGSELDVTGNAVGGKFGLIVRPIEYIRLGGAVHTPVVYSMKETYDTYVDAFYDTAVRPDTKDAFNSFNSEFEYKIGQPAKFIGSLGFVYKNVLNIGVDYEYMDYSACELKDVSSKNDKQIAEELTAVSNIRCGAEFRYGPFTFRGGYASYGNPYKNVSGDNFYRRDISGGVGLATNSFYYDLAVVNAKYNKNTWLYSTSTTDITANSTLKRTCIMFTAGLKF